MYISDTKFTGDVNEEKEVALEFDNFCVDGILNNISFKIYKNSVISIIGPSGSGKSTLLRAINRTDKHDRKVGGRILLFGQDIASIKPIENLRMKIGMVFQRPMLFPMSIKENVVFALRAHGNCDLKYLDLNMRNSLRQVGIWDEIYDKLDTDPTTLSLGQQQRICIARTIILRPNVLIMDEPTSSLDPISSTKIEQLILSLSKKHTIIIASHSLSQVQRVSNYTLFLKGGKAVEFGETKELFTHPKQKATRDYISGEY